MKNRNKRLLKLLAMSLVLLLALGGLAGCENDKEPEPDDNNNVVDPNGEEEEQPREISVYLYYVNEDYLVTGEGDMLVRYPAKMEDAEGDELIANTLKALKEVPEDAEGCVTALADITINDAYLGENQNIVVDLASEGLSGGAAEEETLIYQVVETMSASFNAAGVLFLVDGEPADSLMEHFDVSEPVSSMLNE